MARWDSRSELERTTWSASSHPGLEVSHPVVEMEVEEGAAACQKSAWRKPTAACALVVQPTKHSKQHTRHVQAPLSPAYRIQVLPALRHHCLLWRLRPAHITYVLLNTRQQCTPMLTTQSHRLIAHTSKYLTESQYRAQLRAHCVTSLQHAQQLGEAQPAHEASTTAATHRQEQWTPTTTNPAARQANKRTRDRTTNKQTRQPTDHNTDHKAPALAHTMNRQHH